MVRTPCRDGNTGMKKGAWTPEEDRKLTDYITRYGSWNWRQLPKFAGLSRCGKSCRLRWLNYLRPNIKRGDFSQEEEDTIINLHRSLGNRWSAIAASLSGRTDNDIKNHWHTTLKKRVMEYKFNVTKTSSTENETSSNNTTISYNDISSSLEKSLDHDQQQVVLLEQTSTSPLLINPWSPKSLDSFPLMSPLLSLSDFSASTTTNSILEPFDQEDLSGDFWADQFLADTVTTARQEASSYNSPDEFGAVTMEKNIANKDLLEPMIVSRNAKTSSRTSTNSVEAFGQEYSYSDESLWSDPFWDDNTSDHDPFPDPQHFSSVFDEFLYLVT